MTVSLLEAFVHPSAGEFNNLRLAWIGDAAMQLVVSDLVFESLPELATTDILTDRRKAMVMRDFCAEGAIKLGWDKVAVAGKSFPKDKELTTNMLAEVFEAVWGAIYKDSGNNQAVVHDVYKRLFPLHALSSNEAAEEAAAATAEESASAVQNWWNNID
ncbi:probable ribonuclease 3 [Coccomyxa sp. Obi]|nr:probable ribonuclease 3 [Coccomyxa sp. Obi]